jgi:hypothetical protein
LDHRSSREVSDGLLLIGMVVGIISLMTVMTRLSAHPASSSPVSLERNGNLVASSLSTTSQVRLGDQGVRGTVSPDHLDRGKRGGQGDARLDLRDAATMARWYLWTRPGSEETRTDLWINAPASIGSTSPPDASPANVFPEE